MSKLTLLACGLLLGCTPEPRRAAERPRVVLAARAPGSVAAPTPMPPPPPGYDERCVRTYPDEKGYARYDFSCDWRKEAEAKAARHSDSIALETAARKEACEARGGEWSKHGWFEFEGCAWHAKDAGKPCRDRTQCESRVCLAPATASRDTPATGGCFECVGDCAFSGNVVENGVTRAKLHVD